LKNTDRKGKTNCGGMKKEKEKQKQKQNKKKQFTSRR